MIRSPASYATGIAEHPSLGCAPELAHGLVFACDARLGSTGDLVRDLARKSWGTVNNATLTNFWAKTPRGLALDFVNGGTSYVNFGSPARLANLGPMTICTRMYARTYGEFGAVRIVMKATGNPFVSGWSLQLVDAILGGQKGLIFGRGYSSTSLQKQAVFANLLNAWRDVAVSWDGSSSASNVRIYVDSQESGSVSETNAVGTIQSDASSNLWLGRSQSNSREFDGMIQYVLIFNRVLTLDQINDVHQHAQAIWTPADDSGFVPQIFTPPDLFESQIVGGM